MSGEYNRTYRGTKRTMNCFCRLLYTSLYSYLKMPMTIIVLEFELERRARLCMHVKMTYYTKIINSIIQYG